MLDARSLLNNSAITNLIRTCARAKKVGQFLPSLPKTVKLWCVNFMKWEWSGMRID